MGKDCSFIWISTFTGPSVTQDRVKAILWKEETLALEESNVNCCALWKQGGGIFEETAELSLGFAFPDWEMAWEVRIPGLWEENR